MGKVRNASNTLRTGRIGENTWYVRDGEQIVRQRLNNSNYGEGARRTEVQQQRRAKWGNLVNFFKVIAEFERSAFETKDRGVTDYNMFMKMNANTSPVYLTKQQVESGSSVVAPYVISRGSLSSVTLEQEQDGQEHNLLSFLTNIEIGSVDFETGTIATISTSIINYNDSWQNGDNLGCMVLWMDLSNPDNPRSYYAYKEFTLDTTDTRTPAQAGVDFLSNSGSVVRFSPDVLHIGDNYSSVACIHTRKENGLKTSNQSIVTIAAGPQSPGQPITAYTSDAAKTAAVNSYGVDGEVIIAPNL